MAIEKIKILGAVLELPAKQHYLLIQPIWPIFLVNWLDWHCCLADKGQIISKQLLVSSDASKK